MIGVFFLLKYRKGFLIRRRYETRPRASRNFALTEPGEEFLLGRPVEWEVDLPGERFQREAA